MREIIPMIWSPLAGAWIYEDYGLAQIACMRIAEDDKEMALRIYTPLFNNRGNEDGYSQGLWNVTVAAGNLDYVAHVNGEYISIYDIWINEERYSANEAGKLLR